MVRDADKRDEKPEFQAAARQCTSRCSWGEPSVVDIMVWEKFFDRVNHDHSDASGSQANQRQGIAFVDSVRFTSGIHGRRTNHSEPRRKTRYTTLV
jgi:hypothetical protein